MASIKSSRAKTYRTKTVVAENEAPEHVPSEGELLIKEMVKKQLDTKISLSHQLQTEKEFEKAVEFESVTQYVSGQSTLKEFEETTSKVARREDLHSLGLSGEEIQLLLDRDKGEDFCVEKYKNVEGSVLQSRIDTIQSKIDEGASRLRTEESLSEDINEFDQKETAATNPASDLSKLYQFASQCKPTNKDTRLPSHPINQLKEIEHDLFGHLKTSKAKKKNKRPSKIKSVPANSHAEETHASSSSGNASRKRVGSHWDIETVPKKSSGLLTREYTCKPEVLYTIKNNQIVPITRNATATTSTVRACDSSGPLFGKEFVLSNVPEKKDDMSISIEQLSVEQIQELPRFSNYSPGIPSKSLFIKNLPNNTREEDLVDLFGQFESADKSRITYRLMSGKMKGQAFITFSDIDTAVAALDSINGRILKGRPVIIQYGKSA